MTTDHTPALAAEGMDLGALEEQSAAVLPPKLQAVIDAASEWWSERTPDDWDSADLAKAVIRLHGDWLGCPGCDFQCGEPCTPATEAEQLHAVDCHIAQLVHDGKLHAGNDYKPPEGWTPEVDARKKRVAPPEPQAQAVLADPSYFQLEQLFDAVHAHGEFGRGFREEARLILRAPPPVAPAPADQSAVRCAACDKPAMGALVRGVRTFPTTCHCGSNTFNVCVGAAPAAVPARPGSPLQTPAGSSTAIPNAEAQ